MKEMYEYLLENHMKENDYASVKSDYGKALSSINSCLDIIDRDNSVFLDINIDRVDVVREMDRIIALL